MLHIGVDCGSRVLFLANRGRSSLPWLPLPFVTYEDPRIIVSSGVIVALASVTMSCATQLSQYRFRVTDTIYWSPTSVHRTATWLLQHTPVVRVRSGIGSRIKIHDRVSKIPEWRTLQWLGKKSASISFVGQYLMIISPLATRSVTKKYRMLMCRVRLLLNAFPFFLEQDGTLVVLVDVHHRTHFISLRLGEVASPYDLG